MAELDSRFLAYTDCYGQQFSTPGVVHYRLRLGGFRFNSDDEDLFEIDVTGKSGAEARQHHVRVTLRDGRFVADPARLEIATGDNVTWSGDSPGPGYVVEGDGSPSRFTSAELGNKSVYIHPFGLPGVYPWVDSYGSKVGGEIEVEDVRPTSQAEIDRWLKSLEQGHLVHIKGNRVNPARLKVPVGASVCWAVEGEGRISITDARIVGLDQEASRDAEDGQGAEDGHELADRESTKVKAGSARGS
jgi:plastocyanin